MPTLRELQLAFAESIFADGPAAVAASVRPGRFSAERLFSVYRNNVFASLTAALAAVYPVVMRLVGDGFFRYAADHYIRHHPSTGGDLHGFGESFADFLATFRPATRLVYLPDVAGLEWAWHRAFHAADRAPMALPALAHVAPERYGAIRFHLHPSAKLISSAYPVLRIWEVNRPTHGLDDTVDLSCGGDRVLVIRRALAVEVERLAAGEFALLGAFAAGHDLGHACEMALAADPTLDVPAVLRDHAARATLADFEVPLMSRQPAPDATPGRMSV